MSEEGDPWDLSPDEFEDLEEEEHKQNERESAPPGAPPREKKQKTIAGADADPARMKGTDEARERAYKTYELLGFTFSKEEKGDRWRKNVGDLKVAIDFTDEHPEGRPWGKYKSEDAFMAEDEVLALPIMEQARRLVNSEQPLPPAIIVGAVIAKSESGKGILVEFEDAFEGPRKIWYGMGAVKRNAPGSQGYNEKIGENERYIPAGFSKKSDKQEAKMKLPRAIVLPDIINQLETAPVHTHQNGDSSGEAVGEAPRGAAPVVTQKPILEIMAEVEKLKEKKGAEEADQGQFEVTNATLMHLCLSDAIQIVNGVLVPAYPQLTDAVKADFALRIAHTLFIDQGKDRRTPRY